MAPGRKRGGKGAKEKSELSLGDLVLAKVKGFPAWPAKISRPEDWERAPDPKKYFVQFFGTAEIAFVAPADIQAFTSESQKKLSARCQGKTVKYFAQAVKEICEEFDVLQQKKISNIRDDNNAQDLASEAHAADPVADEALEVSADDEREGPKCKLEIDRLSDGSSEFGRSQKKGAMGFQDVKPCLSGDINHSSPALSPGKKSKLSSTPSKRVKGSVLPSVSSSHASVKEEVSHNVKVEGGCSDGGQSGMANNRHQSKLAMGLKRKREGTVQTKYASDGNMKVSFADNLKLDSDLGSGKKIKKFLKEKKHSVAVDGRVYAKVISEEHNEVPSKKMNFQHDHEKLTSPTIEASCPAKISKSVNIVDGANMVRAQTSRKSGPISPVDIDRKMVDKESKRLTSGGKAENHQSFRADKSTNVSNHPTAEYDPPPTERHCLTGGMMSNSALISENINGNSASCRSGLATPNKVRPSGMQLLTKRRAVRLCDDDDDELPKTPVHGGVSHKASAIPHVTDSKNKTVKRGEGCANDRLVSRKLGIIGDALKEQVISTQSSKKTSSPTVQKGMDKRTRETSAEHVSPNQCQLDSKKSPFMEAKSATDLTLSVTAARPLAEPQKKNLSKTPVSISQKKVPSGANRSLNTAFDGSSLDQSINERSKPPSPGEKRKATPLSDSQINDSDISVGNPDENFIALGERLNVGNDSKTSFTVNSKISDSVTSMKHLIAAAQARKKQAHLQNAYTNHFPLVLPDADMLGRSPSSTPVESSQNFQLDVQRLHPNPPSSDVRQLSSANEHENGEFDERRVSSGHQATGSSLSGDTEAAVARDAFEGMIETLSRTKESIGRATRLAIDCAKYGIANEVVELLIRKLENEPSLHRKVDLFFLFDSITQCSHNQKGIAGASYLPIIQAALPRLIGAAAPPGTGAHENRRQCHKVLRLWLERKILPESVLRRYMDDIGTRNDETSTGVSHKRPSRAERAIDDPIRDMEGMLVDEYGSNATFQLAGLLPSHFFYEEEDEDESSFPKQHKKVGDTSPSEHHTPANRDPDICTVTPSDRRHCILEDVDGELEMEDVSAHQKDEEPFSTNDTAWVALHEPNSGGIFQSASSMSEFLPSPEGSPPLPPGSPPGTPPLPTSPPPPPPPPLSPSPPLLPPTLLVHHLFPPPPPPPVFLSEQSLPPQPALMPQRMPPLPPTISSQPVTYYPPPLPHEIGGTPTVNQHVHMVSNTHGSRIDAPVRGEVYSQQSSFFSPAAVSNVRELVGYNSLRLVEYGQSDGYVNRQAPQQTQPFRPGSAPLAQRPLHPEQMTQIPSHFSYPNTAQQNLYLPYSVPSFPDSLRRNTTDDQWRMQGNELSSDDSRRGWVTRGRSCSGPPYSHEGYFGGPLERPTTNVVSFQPSAANSIPAAQISAHGSHVMPSRADVSAVSWRPA